MAGKPPFSPISRGSALCDAWCFDQCSCAFSAAPCGVAREPVAMTPTKALGEKNNWINSGWKCFQVFSRILIHQKVDVFFQPHINKTFWCQGISPEKKSMLPMFLGTFGNHFSMSPLFLGNKIDVTNFLGNIFRCSNHFWKTKSMLSLPKTTLKPLILHYTSMPERWKSWT